MVNPLLLVMTPGAAILPSNIGPLIPCPTNRKYLATPDGKAVYMAGSHTWFDADQSLSGTTLTFAEFLSYVAGFENGNWIRFWAVPSDTWPSGYVGLDSQMPFLRTGPGTANDGNLKWDLNSYNQPQWDKWRADILLAAEQTPPVYVQVNIWCQGSAFMTTVGSPWWGPNNINGCNPLTLAALFTNTGPGSTFDFMSAYAQKWMDTVFDCPNVVFDLWNEVDGGVATLNWGAAMVAFMRNYEATKNYIKHPFILSSSDGNNGAFSGDAALWSSTSADIVVPGWGDTTTTGLFPTASFTGNNIAHPPGTKPGIIDTDHTTIGAMSADYVFNTFCRGWAGHLFMEVLDGTSLNQFALPSFGTGYTGSTGGGVDTTSQARHNLVRGAVWAARTASQLVNLTNMVANDTASSTGNCLTDNTTQFIVYQPNATQSFTVNLPANSTWDVTWVSASSRTTTVEAQLTSGVTAPETLFINTISQTPLNTPLQVTGSFTGGPINPLQYLSGSTFVNFTNFTATNAATGTWSGTGPTYTVANNSATLTVRDSVNTTVQVVSNSFQVGTTVTRSGIPQNWGITLYPNPNAGVTSDQGGGSQGPSGTANANLRFFAHGGTLGGVSVPGTGLKYSCINSWQNVGGDITSFSNGWKSEGGAYAPTTGMIPLQAIASMGVFTPNATWSSILSGASDGYLRGLVQAWANAGYKKVIYRIDWEWQIGTAYGGQFQLDSASKAAQAVPVWQHMYTIMKDEASKHSGFEALIGWNPTQINFMNFPCSNAYPGDAFCDVIQTDMYFSGGQFDNSGWDGYADLTLGSAAQLNGGSPGTIYSSQKALYQNPNIRHMLYHWADFPGAVQFNPNARSAVSAAGDNFGTESCWGIMDLIHFAALHKKPIGVCEGGQWSTKSDSQENLATNGSPTYNVGTGCYAWPGIPDVWMAGYWKSRIAYAQSLGTDFLHFNFFSVAPNNPFYINSGTVGSFKAVPDEVQSINDAFGGTGASLTGFTI